MVTELAFNQFMKVDFKYASSQTRNVISVHTDPNSFYESIILEDKGKSFFKHLVLSPSVASKRVKFTGNRF